jgi:hypothetical protein
VCAKARARLAVLALRTQTRAVGQRCLEPIEVATRNVCPPVRDQPGQMLPNALSHRSSLAVMHCEPFVPQNLRNLQPETLHAFLKILAAGESQIIPLPRVIRARGFRQRRQSAVQSITADVCQRIGAPCGRGGREYNRRTLPTSTGPRFTISSQISPGNFLCNPVS